MSDSLKGGMPESQYRGLPAGGLASVRLLLFLTLLAAGKSAMAGAGGAVPVAPASSAPAAASAPASASAARSAPSLVKEDLVLRRHVDGLGGLERLKSLKSLKIEYTVTTGGLEGTATMLFRSPDKYREDLDLEPLRESSGSNGREIWAKDSNGSVRTLEGLDRKRFETARAMATYRYLLDPAATLTPVVAGPAGEGEARYHLEVPGGDAADLTFDAASGRLLRLVTGGAGDTLVVTFEDWRVVDGIAVPFDVRQSSGDPRYDATRRTLHVTLNPEIDPGAFARPADSPPDFRLADGKSALDVPAEMHQGHIFLSVSIDGGPTLPFLLDTGAGASAIDREAAGRQRLPTVGNLEARGAGGSTEVGLVTTRSIDLPGLTLSNQTIAALPLTDLVPYIGAPIGGILGYDLLSRFVVRVDYAAGTVSFFLPSAFTPPAGVTPLTLVLEGGIPRVRAVVDSGADGLFVVDTGFRGSVLLETRMAERAGLLADGRKTLEDVPGVGVGGETRGSLTRLRSIQLGPIVVPGPLARFSPVSAGTIAGDDDGLLGSEILRRFTVTFDYAGRRLYLEPNAGIADADEFDMSGLFLVKTGRIFSVRRVIPDSPAAEVGIQEGDEIIRVNGKDAALFTLDFMAQLFRAQAGGAINLTVLSGRVPSEKRLVLRRLL